MPKQLVRLPDLGPSPVFEIVSHGRKGRHTPLQLTRADIEAIARTVRNTPEVVVKVSGGGKTAAAVRAHIEYIDRHGKLEIETDEGPTLQGRRAAAGLVEDWNLALSSGQYRKPTPGENDRRPKVVHNLVFSMVRGTPPDKLLAATQKFAREQFALRHRYAMVLHTDQDHPHVHLVVKAESEQGERLYPVESRYLRRKAEAVAQVLRIGEPIADEGKQELLRSRQAILADWARIADQLDVQGERALACEVRAMTAAMPPVVTEKERIAQGLAAQLHAQLARDAAQAPSQGAPAHAR